MEDPVTGFDLGDHEVCNEGENVGDNVLTMLIMA